MARERKSHTEQYRLVVIIFQTCLLVTCTGHVIKDEVDIGEILNHMKMDNSLLNLLHDSPTWNQLLMEQNAENKNPQLLSDSTPEQHKERRESMIRSSNRSLFKFENPYTAYIRQLFDSDKSRQELQMLGHAETPIKTDLSNSKMLNSKNQMKQLEKEEKSLQVEAALSKQEKEQNNKTVEETQNKEDRKENDNEVEDILSKQETEQNRNRVEQILARQHNFNVIQRIASLFGIELVRPGDTSNQEDLSLKEIKHDGSREFEQVREKINDLKTHAEHHEGFANIETVTQTAIEKRVKTVPSRIHGPGPLNKINTLFRWG